MSCLSFFLKTGVTFANFHKMGKLDVLRILLNINLRGKTRESSQRRIIFPVYIRSVGFVWINISQMCDNFIVCKSDGREEIICKGGKSRQGALIYIRFALVREKNH